MKRFYESPSVEIEKFIIDNILTTSGGGIEEGGEDTGIDINAYNEF